MAESVAAQASQGVQPDPTEEVWLHTDYGVVKARVQTNWDCARTLYDVTGPRIGGCLTVYPEPVPTVHEVLPSGIEMAYGDVLAGGNRWQFNSYAHCPRPTRVNGIAVLGYESTTATAVLDGSFSTWARRRINEIQSLRLPDASQDRLTALVRAVLRHWVKRPDLHELRLVVARHEAPGRLTSEQRQVQSIQAEIDKLRAKRRTHQDRANDYRRFLTEQGIPYHDKETA